VRLGVLHCGIADAKKASIQRNDAAGRSLSSRLLIIVVVELSRPVAHHVPAEKKNAVQLLEPTQTLLCSKASLRVLHRSASTLARLIAAS